MSAPLTTRARRGVQFLVRHETMFWWLHSIYALLFGIGVMWLGTRHFTYLRVAFFHITFIWATSLLLPRLTDLSGLAEPWRHRLRLVVNYFNRNFYQQLLFFIIPVYFGSTTLGSWNAVFIVVLAVSAVISTLDLVYDRQLSVRRFWTGLFFAFNVFACVNVALPLLWRVSNLSALRLSAGLAFAGFATLAVRVTDLGRWRPWMALVATGTVLLAIAESGRIGVPPAPLRIVEASFGRSVERTTLRVLEPVDSLAPGWNGRLHVVTAVYAPLGLEERVRHRWYVGDEPVYTSPFYRITGGREEGFRIWTSTPVATTIEADRLRVDVETEGGQLIGRTELRM